MPVGVWNLEWLNHNSQRNYPLASDASAKDVTNSFDLPEDFIVDLYLQLPVDITIQPSRFFVRTIGNYTTGFAVVIAYNADSGPINIASALIPRSGFTGDTAYFLGGLPPFSDVQGTIVIGRLDQMDLQPAGSFEFDLDGGRLEAEVIRPQIKGIGALVAVNGADRSERLQYEVELIAGTNMRITAEPGNIAENILPSIRFDAIEGEGLTDECVCEDTDLGPPIRTINGISPDATGNFEVLGSPCLEIEGITNGIRMSDTCSEPCCGCDELERVTADLELVMRGNRTLEVFLAGLEASVQQTDQVILGSRLGDRGCFS